LKDFPFYNPKEYQKSHFTTDAPPQPFQEFDYWGYFGNEEKKPANGAFELSPTLRFDLARRSASGGP
jgi:hypothetical protein